MNTSDYILLKIIVGKKEDPDFSYHHIQNFTDNLTTYKDTLGKTICAGGGDAFESGLDGLMQTIVCQDIWTHEEMSYGSRRKIIVYLTDEGAHSARDGGEGEFEMSKMGSSCLKA